MAVRSNKKPSRKNAPSRKAAPSRGKGTATHRVKKAKPKAKAKVKPKAAKASAKPKAKPKAKASASKAKAKGAKSPPKGKAKPSPRKAPTPAQAKKARERERALAQREKERAKKEKQRLALQAQRERERAKKEKERERLKRDRDREQARKAKERERERLLAQKAKEAERKAKEAERERQRKEREAERAQREAEREEARRAKEEERARRDAEREAYRKAKEAERERLRKEREAAKRALEGRVAQATRRAQRVSGVGGRGSTTRVYRPDAIPNQSGTRRQATDDDLSRHARPQAAEISTPATPPPAPPPPPPPPVPEHLDERYTLVKQRLEETPESFRHEYAESFDMSWIYHDSALEGVVYTYAELKTAIDPSITVVPDSSLQPVCEEIRRHKAALDMARDLGEKKRAPINVDLIKKIYLVLHPDDGDLKSVKYRKDIPQHRLYFHEYAPPDKIAYRVRQVVDWINGPEAKKIKDPVRIAARAHYDLVRVFPFAQDSGKVARLLMNILLLRAGYPPAIIHSTERQRYYDALKGSLPTIVNMVRDAMKNGMASIEKRLDDHAAASRNFTTQ
ncbi:MAG: Fic family protein [Polyangiaceae bacterium]